MSAPPLLSLRDATVGFGGPPVFAGVELHVGRGDRASLVGRNGSGKSTLMRALVGAIELDAGELYLEPGLAPIWMEQEPRFPPGMTVRDYVADGRHPDHAVDAILAELDLDGARALDTLSGGEGRRASLARVFVAPPDLILLDEPTNHLDLATIDWLERRLLAFPGAALIVSHDRAFLGAVTNRILWLDKGRLRVAERGFAHFEEWREEVLEMEARALEKLDVHLAEETRWLLRGVTARRRRNQGRLARLEDMRAARAALIGGRRGRLRVDLRDGEGRSRMVIEAEGLKKSVPAAGDGAAGPPRVLVRDFSTLILRGDRIGFVGPNGAGKTTLLRMLTGELAPDEGRVKVAEPLARAYFDQKRESLDPRKTLRDVLCPGGGYGVVVQGRARDVRAYLKDFLFDPRQVDSPTGSLSGGERNRLLLARILAQPADLLVLDEPTNDLDTDTLDLLVDLLGDYTGTLLVVSHDRDFLDKVVTSTIIMPGDGTATEYAGGYADAVRQRGAAPTGRIGGLVAARRPAERAAEPARPPRQRAQLGYLEQRELDGLPARIEALAARVAAAEAALADPALYAEGPEAARRAADALAAVKAELAAAEERWLALEARREALAAGARGPA